MRRFRRISCVIIAVFLVGVLSLAVAASPVSDVETVSVRDLGNGAELTMYDAMAEDRPQKLYTVTADGDAWSFALGVKGHSKALVTDATPITRETYPVAAAINGDHFSFKTGITLGMAISDGLILTSPVPAYNADDYYFHALGITEDGTVLTGENPQLYMQCTVGEEDIAIERINRTRELWEGAQVCLFTPAYGESTGTDATGIEFIIRVDEGRVAAGSDMKGEIIAINNDNDSPLEDGTVVLSVSLLQYEAVEMFEVGDEISFYFSFADEAWNDVTFAVGGNLTAVEEGEALSFDYSVGAFSNPQPRSALGVKKDGTLVLAAADGRSDIAGGLTANEMAAYMAEELDCEYAILLDGGGSTALAVTGEGGVLETVNVPSEERPVGNVVYLVQTGTAGVNTETVLWIVCGVVVAAVIAVVTVVLVRKR